MSILDDIYETQSAHGDISKYQESVNGKEIDELEKEIISIVGHDKWKAYSSLRDSSDLHELEAHYKAGFKDAFKLIVEILV